MSMNGTPLSAAAPSSVLTHVAGHTFFCGSAHLMVIRDGSLVAMEPWDGDHPTTDMGVERVALRWLRKQQRGGDGAVIDLFTRKRLL